MKRRSYRSLSSILCITLLVFSYDASYSQPKGPPPGELPSAITPGALSPSKSSPNVRAGKPAIEVPIGSAMSLVHVGSNDSFAITTEGRQAATLVLEAIEEPYEAKARASAAKASAIYDQIIPRENYGGEYSALQWFADYIAASADKRPEFLKNPQVAFFFQVYGGDNFAVLREYLLRKYRLREIGDEETKAGQDRKIWLEDTILFENPRRESWDKSSKLIKLIDLKPGQQIADVGSGPGYYSFQFANMVGSGGHIYAIDMNAEHLKYIENAKRAMGVTNVSTIETDGKSVGLAGVQTKVDAIFLCSLYHNMYAMATQPERDSFVESIKQSLKEDGKLYLVDNGLVPPGVLPYHGPYVAKELIIGQMLNYGFDLIKQDQYIPQRYLLVFKVKKPVVAEAAGVKPSAGTKSTKPAPTKPKKSYAKKRKPSRS